MKSQHSEKLLLLVNVVGVVVIALVVVAPLLPVFVDCFICFVYLSLPPAFFTCCINFLFLFFSSFLLLQVFCHVAVLFGRALLLLINVDPVQEAVRCMRQSLTLLHHSGRWQSLLGLSCLLLPKGLRTAHALSEQCCRGRTREDDRFADDKGELILPALKDVPDCRLCPHLDTIYAFHCQSLLYEFWWNGVCLCSKTQDSDCTTNRCSLSLGRLARGLLSQQRARFVCLSRFAGQLETERSSAARQQALLHAQETSERRILTKASQKQRRLMKAEARTGAGDVGQGAAEADKGPAISSAEENLATNGLSNTSQDLVENTEQLASDLRKYEALEVGLCPPPPPPPINTLSICNDVDRQEKYTRRECGVGRRILEGKEGMFNGMRVLVCHYVIDQVIIVEHFKHQEISEQCVVNMAIDDELKDVRWEKSKVMGEVIIAILHFFSQVGALPEPQEAALILLHASSHHRCQHPNAVDGLSELRSCVSAWALRHAPSSDYSQRVGQFT